MAAFSWIIRPLRGILRRRQSQNHFQKFSFESPLINFFCLLYFRLHSHHSPNFFELPPFVELFLVLAFYPLLMILRWKSPFVHRPKYLSFSKRLCHFSKNFYRKDRIINDETETNEVASMQK